MSASQPLSLLSRASRSSHGSPSPSTHIPRTPKKMPDIGGPVCLGCAPGERDLAFLGHPSAAWYGPAGRITWGVLGSDVGF